MDANWCPVCGGELADAGAEHDLWWCPEEHDGPRVFLTCEVPPRPWWTMADVRAAVRRECRQWNGSAYAPVAVGQTVYGGPGGHYVLSSQDQGADEGRRWRVWRWLPAEGRVTSVVAEELGYATAAAARRTAGALAAGGRPGPGDAGRGARRRGQIAEGVAAEAAGGGDAWVRRGEPWLAQELPPAVLWLG